MTRTASQHAHARLPTLPHTACMHRCRFAAAPHPPKINITVVASTPLAADASARGWGYPKGRKSSTPDTGPWCQELGTYSQTVTSTVRYRTLACMSATRSLHHQPHHPPKHPTPCSPPAAPPTHNFAATPTVLLQRPLYCAATPTVLYWKLTGNTLWRYELRTFC